MNRHSREKFMRLKILSKVRRCDGGFLFKITFTTERIHAVTFTAKPSPLSNCTLRTATNHSLDALEVECRAGYDGGLPQRFVLEAYDSYTMRMRLNLSSSNADYPMFRIELGELLPPNGDGLPPTLRILVYAQNAKGRSEKVVLEDITLNDAEKRTG